MFTNFRILVVLLLCVSRLCAQTKDAGLWMDVGFSRELGDRFELSVSPELRLDENLTRWSRLFADASLEYKYNKNFSLSAAYRGGAGNDGVHVDGRHRMQYGLGVKQKWNDWTVQYHSRVQFALNAAWSDADVDFNTTWRNRVTVKYSGLKKTDLSTAFEIFNAISVYQEMAFTNWRWTSQVARKINKNQSASIGYLIQRDMTDSPQHIDFVILLSYKVEL
jgi:hypothetical protein